MTPEQTERKIKYSKITPESFIGNKMEDYKHDEVGKTQLDYDRNFVNLMLFGKKPTKTVEN